MYITYINFHFFLLYHPLDKLITYDKINPVRQKRLPTSLKCVNPHIGLTGIICPIWESDVMFLGLRIKCVLIRDHNFLCEIFFFFHAGSKKMVMWFIFSWYCCAVFIWEKLSYIYKSERQDALTHLGAYMFRTAPENLNLILQSTISSLTGYDAQGI